MSEPAIKANEREAQRLFERGVAAARGGQRRVAAGLLARAVQLNPRHEASWLWLSGMLDQPDEIAFCLRSVLAINPNNQRAQQGLTWLSSRTHAASGAPQAGLSSRVAALSIPESATSALPPIGSTEGASWLRRATDGIKAARPVDAQAVLEHELHAHSQSESWWVSFRRTRRDMGRARLFMWSVPILLLVLTLALNLALREAVQRNEQLAQQAAIAAARPPALEADPAQVGRTIEVVLSELPPSDDARALAYLSAVEPTRARLRAAVQEFRATTGRPGGSSTTHAAAAQRLRDAIELSYTTIAELSPPASLAQSHAYYLSGLETELTALDDMLVFYSSFSTEVANRATIRMSEASRALERAQQGFAQRTRSIAHPENMAHTIR